LPSARKGLGGLLIHPDFVQSLRIPAIFSILRKGAERRNALRRNRPG
jgi:hypothetical protein